MRLSTINNVLRLFGLVLVISIGAKHPTRILLMTERRWKRDYIKALGVVVSCQNGG